MEKGKTARERAKKRYNDKTYSTYCLSIEKERLLQFKEKCKQKGISQRSIVLQAIDEFLSR